MHRHRWFVLPLCLGALCCGAVAEEVTPLPAKGFFRVEKREGRWWLVDPDGNLFLSKGVTTVQFRQDHIQGTNRSPYGETNLKKYGTEDTWRDAVAKRLIGWGFNTLGAWSDIKISRIDFHGKYLAYTLNLDLGGKYVSQKQKGTNAWMHGVFPDVFDPEFARLAHAVAKEYCGSMKDDRRLLGWFTDNELRWGPDWRGKDELLTLFLALPEKAPGRIAALNFLRLRYPDVQKFNKVWGTRFASWEEAIMKGAIQPPYVRKSLPRQNEEMERKANEVDARRAAFVADCEAFLGEIAELYFKTCGEAIRSANPNHMNFGCRFAYVPPSVVIKAAARHLDVISFNCYTLDPRDVIDRYSVFDKPLIIGEFSFKGEDSGLPNTRGAGPKLKTQADRARAFENYAQWALGKPNLVGYHWFEHADEPREGRFDGEDSNFGVVNIQDEVYRELTNTMTAVNSRAEKLHAGAK